MGALKELLIIVALIAVILVAFIWMTGPVTLGR
jgi:hypothetical protein